MGKAGRWLKNFLVGKKEKRIENQPTDDFSITVSLPAPKEKRRWSFQRPAMAVQNMNSTDPIAPQLVRQLSESEIETRRARAIELAMGRAAKAAAIAPQPAAAQLRHITASAPLCQITASAPLRQITRITKVNDLSIIEGAATKIQSVFRSYLARRALSALKGLVKLQAMVRGHLVRKQATAALQCIESLVMAQARAHAQRMRMVEVTQDSSQQQPIRRRASLDFQYKKIYARQEMSRTSDEDVKIVEMDYGEPRASLKSRSNYNIMQTDRIDHYYGIQEQHQQFSPAPSAASMDNMLRGYTEHSGEYPPIKAKGSSHESSVASVSNATQTSLRHCGPNYMANTQSSRAKSRSHSAPKQRPDSYERQTSGRRAAVEGKETSSGAKMKRASSNTSLAVRGNQYPRSIKLDQSSTSVKDSECNSSSNKLTSTNCS